MLRRLPRRSNVHRYPLIKYFGPYAKKTPEIWSWKRPQVVRSYYVGWIITLLPAGGIQILLALMLAIAFKANVPVAAGLQFVSNPLTAAPILFSTYHIGKGSLGIFGVAPTGMAAGIAVNLVIGAILGGLLCAAICHFAHTVIAGRAKARAAAPASQGQITS